MNDTDKKEQLPVHIILGASDFAKIKIEKVPRVGKVGEPFAELTKMRWVMMSPGRETSVIDYENLCGKKAITIMMNLCSWNSKKQLNRSKEGWYETGLIWRENKVTLGNNKCGSLNRIKSLLKNLYQREEVREAYDIVVKDQLENNIREEVTDAEINNSSKEFYMPHRAVVRDGTESPKLLVVYDTSVKFECGFSLNDCLEKGPPPQNKL